MTRYVVAAFFGALLGIGGVVFYNNLPKILAMNKSSDAPIVQEKKQVIGFLLYSLLSRAQTDYSNEITTLSYFGLTIDPDGTIKKLNNEVEAEPGWHALNSGVVDKFLQKAKEKHVALSLVVFSGNSDDIETLLDEPVTHAKNLTNEVLPIMNKYGFTNLNLDVEHTREASPDAQEKFIQFTRTVKEELKRADKTLTVDVTTLDLIRNDTLIKPKEIAKLADYIVIMAYDYHAQGSSVTGPVAPLGGAGIESEYDAEAAVQNALLAIPKKKILLGMPLYGYEWETLTNVPRAAIIPGTGYAASNRRAEKLVSDCATCSAQFDEIAQEAYVIYSDPQTNTYHQLFYPTKTSTEHKIKLAQDNDLGGLALWSLGYEGNSILLPLQSYLK